MAVKDIYTTLLLLLAAAVLEAGGDAVVRTGLRASTIGARVMLFAAGGLVLFAYGYVVNAPPWDFGQLLGVYVVFFFIVAQLISWLIFHQRPSAAVLVGGGFIVFGGIIISYGSF
jgi:drug/metabolite transporter (DMT)-like permease